ncbi:PIN domain-containing protein [soil metagenome]
MRVLRDTNVVLEILLRRGPWLAVAEAIRQAGQEVRLIGYITASALTDIYYIGRRLVGREAARTMVRECLDSLMILPIARNDLEAAFASPLQDFEDALQVASAIHHGLVAIITRDPSDFESSSIPILSPSALASRLSAADD